GLQEGSEVGDRGLLLSGRLARQLAKPLADRRQPQLDRVRLDQRLECLLLGARRHQLPPPSIASYWARSGSAAIARTIPAASSVTSSVWARSERRASSATARPSWAPAAISAADGELDPLGPELFAEQEHVDHLARRLRRSRALLDRPPKRIEA